MVDHDLIARACDIVELVPCVWHDDGRAAAYCEASVWEEALKREDGRVILIPGETYPINDALHALLVWRLVKTLAARPYVWHEDDTEQAPIEMWTNGEVWNISRQTDCGTFDVGSGGDLKEIIHALVEELEEEG